MLSNSVCGLSITITIFKIANLIFLSLSKYFRWLEHVAKAKTSDALSKLMGLKATDAIIVTLDDEGSVVAEKLVQVKIVENHKQLSKFNQLQITFLY